MNFVSLADFRVNAEKVIAKNAFDYYKSGAGDEFTLRLNKTAYEKYIKFELLLKYFEF